MAPLRCIAAKKLPYNFHNNNLGAKTTAPVKRGGGFLVF
jgi:hypothetical protein